MADGSRKLSGVSPKEIEEIMTAFQQQNECLLSIEMRVGVIAGKASLELVCHAWNNKKLKSEVPLLASASVRCSALRAASLEGAIIRLLYSLDAKLAWGELGGAEIPKA